MKKESILGILTGAAFLMATSSIGPGFLTQTAYFTEKLKASFAFAIVISIAIDIIVQINIWLILSVSKMRAQDLANKLLPGLGFFISFLVVVGGLTFNIGNVGGASLGLNVLFDMDITLAAIISSLIAIFIFAQKEMGRALDHFARLLGIIMILMVFYVVFKTKPPMVLVGQQMFLPEQMDWLTILTLVGGTVGGYISFAGAHRIIDANLVGVEYIKNVRNGAINAILITGIMRFLLFLAVLGVVFMGFALDPENPPASAFKYGLGNTGYRIFGIILWCASITSVVGASYTSVSFIKTFSKKINNYEKYWIIFFIIISTLIFITIGKPVKLLIFAGSLNGLILPVAITTILIATFKKDIMGTYKHSLILLVAGFVVAIFTFYIAFITFFKIFDIFK